MTATADIFPGFRSVSPLENLGRSVVRGAEEAWRKISYQDARGEVVPDLLGYVSGLDSLLSAPPAKANDAIVKTREGVARMVALGLLAEHTASDVMFRRGGATIFLEEDTQSWLRAAGISPLYLDGLDAGVTHALETSLFGDAQTIGRLNAADSVSPFGALSEQSLGFLFQGAYRRARGVLLSSRPRNQRLAEQIEASFSQAMGDPKAVYQAVENAAGLLLPLVGGGATEPLFKPTRSEATALRLLCRGLSPKERITLLADPQMKGRINGGRMESVPAIVERVGEELKHVFAWAGAEEMWNAYSDETRRTLVFLASNVDAPLKDRVGMLLQQPSLLKFLHDLPPEAQAHFAPIMIDAAHVAGIVSETADVYALTKLELPGWAQKAGRDVVRYFSMSPQGSDGPRKPRWGRIGTSVLIIAATVAGCVAPVGQQTLPAPGVGITPDYTPTTGPSFTPLSPDATPIVIGPSPTAFNGGWRVGDFPRIAPLAAPDSFSPSSLPSDFTIRMQDLIDFEKSDPRCGGANCNTLVAISQLDGDTRAAYFLQSPGGEIYVAVRNPDGTFNRGESEWVPVLTTFDGKKLTPVWLFDFQIDPKSGKPFAVGGSQAFSRIGFAIEGENGLDGQDPMVALWHSPFGEGETQLLVKDPARLFGTAFPHRDDREFMLIVDANGEMTGGYYQYGSDGNVLWTASPEDAQGKFGKWRLQDIDGAWKWEWLAASIATAPAPPPTFTSEPTPAPTATLAEPMPTSCLDKDGETAVVQTFLQKKGYDTLDMAMNDFVTNNLPGFGAGGRDSNINWWLDASNKMAVMIDISKALLLGQYTAKHDNIEINCVTIAYPSVVRTANGITIIPRVVSIISDATIHGRYTKVNFYNSPTEGVLMNSPQEAHEWINSRIGKAIKIRIVPALPPDPKGPPVFGLEFDKAGDSWHRLMTIADGTAVQWLGADPSKYPVGVSPVTPDPEALAEGIRNMTQGGNGYEPGLFSSAAGFFDISS